MSSIGRSLGLPFDGETGQHNAITDVPGVLVGYCTLNKPRMELKVGEGPVNTGVTAILPRGYHDRLSPIWAGQFSLNGNGEMTGTHWIKDAGYFTSPICLTNTHSVGAVHAGVVRWMTQQYADDFQQDHAWAMPVVAETYDGLTNDINGQHVTDDDVIAALNSATDGDIEEGNVGGGTGMLTYEFKGGTGTASRRVDIEGSEYTLGVLVQSNFGSREDLRILGIPVGKHWPEDAVLTELSQQETGSIIVIIGTDAPLLPVQLQRLAKRGALGIARTGTPGGHYSGDIMLAFSVANDIGLPGITGGQHPLTYRLEFLNDHYFESLCRAAARATEEAIINAMLAAQDLPTCKPPGFTVKAIDHERLKRFF